MRTDNDTTSWILNQSRQRANRLDDWQLGLPIGIVCAGLMLFAACSPKRDSKAIDPLPSDRRTPVVVEDSEHPTSNQRLTIPGLRTTGPTRPVQQELEHLDPSADDWDSETFSELASQQLQRLSHAMSDSASVDDGVFAAAFTCTALRPTKMRKVFDDGLLRVSRATVDRASQQMSWKAAFEGLSDSFPENASLSVRFKIVRVDLQQAVATTEVHLHLVANAKDISSQQNAVWGCRWHWADRADPPRLARIDLEEFEEVTRNSVRPLLVESTQSVLPADADIQVQFAHGIDLWRRQIDRRFGIEITGPHGLAVGDANGDGLDDLYICEPGGLPNRLLLQKLDGTTQEFSATASVDYLEPTHAALFVDLDNDGDQDLILAASRYILFLSNDGNASFTRQLIHTTPSVSRSLSAADYDQDGDVDIYVCGYFARDVDENGTGLGRPMPYHDANNGSENTLLSNESAWRFRDVTNDAGLSTNNQRFSYAASWADYDQDGDLDLYVANDFGRNNLYQNNHGLFRDVASAAGVEDISAGMSVSWADYNRDGWLDLYIGNMFSSAGNRVTYQRHFGQNDQLATKALYQRHARGNTLFRNIGDGTFADVSLAAGVNMGRWAWGCNTVDLNNDGWEDMVVANGMITNRDDDGDL